MDTTIPRRSREARGLGGSFLYFFNQMSVFVEYNGLDNNFNVFIFVRIMWFCCGVRSLANNTEDGSLISDITASMD